MMPGMPERRTHDYVRNGTTGLFAAFNIAAGTVISDLHRRHRAIELKKFLATIDKTVPEGMDIHVVCDNYGTIGAIVLVDKQLPEPAANIYTTLSRHPGTPCHQPQRPNFTALVWNPPRGRRRTRAWPAVRPRPRPSATAEQSDPQP